MYEKIADYVKERGLAWGELTFNDTLATAQAAGARWSDVVICEAMEEKGLTYQQVLQSVYDAFSYNLSVMELGMKEESSSYIIGIIGSQLKQLKQTGQPLFDDAFLFDAVRYTLSAQVGNHTCGLEPCAGTGDSCVFTGVVRAMMDTGKDWDTVGRAIAVMLKIGSFYRVGKRLTGCNMEGLGAGAAGTAGAVTELLGGTPEQVAKAVCMAISPTVAVPCIPKIVVKGLCSAHIGGAVCIGYLTAKLNLMIDVPCITDADTMFAMAAKAHIASAKHVTPVAGEYMAPYYYRSEEVEPYVCEEDRLREDEAAKAILRQSEQEVRQIAREANSITHPFGVATVGGSSAAVGSPANMGRIAHRMLDGRKIRKITIDLYQDHFYRRSKNIPGILMGAVLGAGTDDMDAYLGVMEKVRQMDLSIVINRVDEPALQRIRLDHEDGYVMVDSRGRGSGRICLVDAYPSLADALKAAEELGIEVVS